jgi:hypothetical protein
LEPTQFQGSTGVNVQQGRGVTALTRFDVTGKLGDEVVRAVFEDGRLFVDGRLLTHVTLLVELGEVVQVEALGVSMPTTLDGPPFAVYMTLLGACDRIIGSSCNSDPQPFG